MSKQYKIWSACIVVTFVVCLTGVILLHRNTLKRGASCVNCNVLIMDIDTLRADDLPCYGYARNTAPHLCAFAKKAVLFEHNYSPATWTLPSIFTTITSLYTPFHRVRSIFTDVLSPDIPTLPKVLHAAGYETVFISNVQAPVILTKQNGGLAGFDRVVLIPKGEVLSRAISSILSEQGKKKFIYFYTQSLHAPYLIDTGENPIEKLPPPKGFPITFDEFDRIINAYLKANYLAIFTKEGIMKYHDVIFSKNDTSLADLFWSLTPEETFTMLYDEWKPIYDAYMQFIDTHNPSHLSFLRMMYDTKISRVDTQLQPLFEQLDKKPLKENTITIVMSDHSEAFGEHGTFVHDYNGHSELYHTPLIIRGPTLQPQKINSPTGNIDIFPTVLELLKLPKQSALQGRSLIPYVTDKFSDINRLIISSNYYDIIYQNTEWLYNVSLDSTSIDDTVLYNKLKDPDEKNNVVQEYLPFVEPLYKQFKVIQSYESLFPQINIPPPASPIRISPDKQERLKKEGYF